MYRNDSNASFSAAAMIAAVERRSPQPAPRYRSRDFGTGYGRSSGYATARSYAPDSQPALRFRVG